jgi:signal transduction histidine kinase
MALAAPRAREAATVPMLSRYFRRTSPLRYEARLTVATTALVAVLCAGLSWQLARGALGGLRAHLLQQARSVVGVLARDAEIALRHGDLGALADAAERARLEGNVLAVRVFDPRGLLLVATGTTAGGDVGGASSATRVAGEPVAVNPSVWELWSPIPSSPLADSGSLGSVSVRVSVTPLADLRSRVVFTATTFTVLFMMVGALGAFGVARTMTRPLSGLVRATEAIASGDFTVRVPAERQDELGTLARMFNVMAGSLAGSRTALEDKVRELERANQLKSEFLTTVSHELRTPLNVIMGSLEMAEEYAAGRPPELRTLLGTIRRYASLQLDLVTSVLDFGRLSSGEPSYRVETFDLKALVDDVLALQSNRMRPGVLLQAVIDPDCRSLTTDRIKLHQILRNLVDNAAKFTESGRVVVEVGAQAPERLAITVSDTGPGIPPEEVARIFEPFHQVGSSTTRQTTGVGLGLSIAKQLAVALGGDISVMSELGWGSTFRVEIPRVLPGTSRTRARPTSAAAAAARRAA